MVGLAWFRLSMKLLFGIYRNYLLRNASWSWLNCNIILKTSSMENWVLLLVLDLILVERKRVCNMCPTKNRSYSWSCMIAPSWSLVTNLLTPMFTSQLSSCWSVHLCLRLHSCLSLFTSQISQYLSWFHGKMENKEDPFTEYRHEFFGINLRNRKTLTMESLVAPGWTLIVGISKLIVCSYSGNHRQNLEFALGIAVAAKIFVLVGHGI